MTSFEGDTSPSLQYADVRLTHKNPELLPAPEHVVAWSCSHFALRARSRARGILSWSRARRTSSGRGRGCGWMCLYARDVLGTGIRLLSIRPLEAHVRDGGVRNSGSSLPLWNSCTLCAVGTYNVAEESKQWKRRCNRPLLIKLNQDYVYISPQETQLHSASFTSL
jgi:hypothetical protein